MPNKEQNIHNNSMSRLMLWVSLSLIHHEKMWEIEQPITFSSLNLTKAWGNPQE